MTDSPPLETLKNAYREWHESKGRSTDCWVNIISNESVHIETFDPVSASIAATSGKIKSSKDELLSYLTGITNSWNMVHFTPETFVCENDRIAMFGRCAWTNKATKKTVEVQIAHLWRFKNGKAIEYSELFDSARVVAAATA